MTDKQSNYYLMKYLNKVFDPTICHFELDNVLQTLQEIMQAVSPHLKGRASSLHLPWDFK